VSKTISPRVSSYLDWEINFRKKKDMKRNQINNKKVIVLRKNVNSLGISEKKFKEFMKKWNETNFLK